MSTKTKHTETPFKAERIEGAWYINGPFSRVATLATGKGDAEDAAFIVQACNAHAELVEVLRWLEDELCSGGDRDGMVRDIRKTLAKFNTTEGSGK